MREPKQGGGAGAWRLVALMVLVVAAMAWVSFRGQSTRGGGDERVLWLSDHAQASALAADSGKPLLVNFTQAGCGGCEYLKRRVFTDARVAEQIERHFVPVRVDLTPGVVTALGEELAIRYQVAFLPTLVVTRADGRPIASETGAHEAEQVLAWLESIAGFSRPEPVAAHVP